MRKAHGQKNADRGYRFFAHTIRASWPKRLHLAGVSKRVRFDKRTEP